MADVKTPAPPSPEADKDGGGNGPSWVDYAGIAAAVILLVILADVFSGGRVITRRLTRRPPPADPAPDVPAAQ